MKTGIITNNEVSFMSADLIPKDPIPLDYAVSNDGIEIDKGIRETIRGIRFSILAMGLGLANMKAKSLYNDLGYKNMTQYIRKLSDDTKMDTSSILNWLRIGKVYLKHKTDLDLAGFSDIDGPTKLPYLERALEKNEKHEVFDNIKNMSVRDFVVFAKKQIETDSHTGNTDRTVVAVRGNSIYIDGNLAIIISKKLDRRVSAYFKKVIRVACEALVEEEVILPVRLHSRREARRFEPMVERLKIKMRKRQA